ncbi:MULTISPECIES: hypothetical protein [unclassified Methylobacterium]|uniref:hypothetical protein n=1 Tax=unclassified Methylobacterium TaxID=2615210 RepID=UPI0036FFBDE0
MYEGHQFNSVEQNYAEKLPSARYSIHTTGEVHRYARGSRSATTYIEPLYRLSKFHQIAFISIPKVGKLDDYDESRHQSDVSALIDVGSEENTRLTFTMSIGPKIAQLSNKEYIEINYEIYRLIVIPAKLPLAIPREQSEYFICGMPRVGEFQTRQIDKTQAELDFYKSINPDVPQIYREPGGAYVVFAQTPMARSPHFAVRFNRPDLKAEMIPFTSKNEINHKVRFWIFDKGGKNKIDDLRKHILSYTLDAEIS